MFFNHICFLVNTNLYDTKRYFVNCLAQACQRAGIYTTTIDISTWSLATAKKIALLQPDLTCSFNEVLPDEEGKFIWDDLQIPHLALIVDPIIYSLHLTKSPYSLITTVDRYDLDFLRSTGFNRSFFFPHAVDAATAPGKEEDRCYDVVFIGSCYDHEAIKADWQQKCAPREGKLIEEAIERVLADNRTPFVQAVWDTLQAASVAISEVNFQQLCYYTDYYLRGKDRVELVQALKNVELHLFGQLHPETHLSKNQRQGWQRYVGDRANVHLHPPISYIDSLKIVERAKICLNSTPSFKNGTHPRIFAGMAAESLIVTNDNQFFREHFQDGQDLVLYRHNHWAELDDRLASLLASPQRLEIAKEGRIKAMKHHTWDQRVETLQQEIPPLLAAQLSN